MTHPQDVSPDGENGAVETLAVAIQKLAFCVRGLSFGTTGAPRDISNEVVESMTKLLTTTRANEPTRIPSARESAKRLGLNIKPRPDAIDEVAPGPCAEDLGLNEPTPGGGWRHVAEYFLGDFTDTHTPEECRAEAIRRTAATPAPESKACVCTHTSLGCDCLACPLDDDMWRCSSCGEGRTQRELRDGFHTAWRFDGVVYEHKCPENHSQCGYFEARLFPASSADAKQEEKCVCSHTAEMHGASWGTPCAALGCMCPRFSPALPADAKQGNQEKALPEVAMPSADLAAWRESHDADTARTQAATARDLGDSPAPADKGEPGCRYPSFSGQPCGECRACDADTIADLRAQVKRWEDKEASRGHQCWLVEKERDELLAEMKRREEAMPGYVLAALYESAISRADELRAECERLKAERDEWKAATEYNQSAIEAAVSGENAFRDTVDKLAKALREFVVAYDDGGSTDETDAAFYRARAALKDSGLELTERSKT